MATTVLFAGKLRVQPGVYSDTRIRSTTTKNSAVPDVIAILGLSEGGEPQVPLHFTDPNQCREVLRAGDLLTACNFAWSPSGSEAGANEIIAVRVTPAIKGSVIIDDLAAADAMTIESLDWGAWTNNIRFKVEDGSRAVDTDWSAQIDNVAGIGPADATIAFDTGVGTLPANGIIKIENEYIQYTGKTGTSVAGTLTGCIRGIYRARGGAAAAHADEVAIALLDLPGVVKITVENQLDPGVFETYNNLGEAMTLLYTGAGTAALVTVTVTAGLAVTLAATVTGAASDDFSFDLTLTQYDTMQKVKNAIESLANWTATLKCPGDTPSSDLDKVAALEAKLNSSIPLQLMRIGSSMVSALAGSRYIKATKVAAASTAPANIAYTSFASGADGTDNAAAWTAALTALAPEQDVSIVVPATGELANQVLVMEHVRNRVDLDGLRQVMFTGSDVDDTVQNAIDASTTFASFRASYFYPGVKRSDNAGVVKTYGGWAVAAMAAGLDVGSQGRRSIGNLRLLVGGVEKKLTNSDLDALILAGVSPLRSISGQGTYILKSVTTQISGESFWSQRTNVKIVDFILNDLEADLNATYIQRLITPSLLVGIHNTTGAKLQSYAESGFLFASETQPGFKNIRVRSVASVVFVDFEAAISQPADFILLTASFTPGESAAA